MSKICDEVIEVLERLIDALTPGSPSPTPRPGSVPDHADCVLYLHPIDLVHAAGPRLDALASSYPPVGGWMSASSIEIVPYVQAASATHETGARTIRDQSGAFDFRVELNCRREVMNVLDVALSLVHELAHIDHAHTVGFLPQDVVAIADENEWVALAWTFEERAFEHQVRAAETICFEDLAAGRYRDGYQNGWVWSVFIQDVLAPLHSGDRARARAEIKSTYPESELRAHWSASQSAAPASAHFAAIWSVYATFHTDDDRARWGV